MFAKILSYIYGSLTWNLPKIISSVCIVKAFGYIFINNYFAEQILNVVLFSG